MAQPELLPAQSNSRSAESLTSVRFGAQASRPSPARSSTPPLPTITSNVDPDNQSLIRDANSFDSDSTPGISDQRPQILLVSEFKPLFTKQPGGTVPYLPTNAKSYFDTILETRRLKAQNSFLEYDNLARNSAPIKSQFQKIFSQNASLVSFLRQKFESILDIHQDIERFKSSLDPRETTVSLDVEMGRNFPQLLSTNGALQENLGGSSVTFKAQELLEEMGFVSGNIGKYSNTKVLGQIILGLVELSKNKKFNNLIHLIQARADNSQTILNISGLNIPINTPPPRNLILPTRIADVHNICFQVLKKWDYLAKDTDRTFLTNNNNNGSIQYPDNRFYNALEYISTELRVSYSKKRITSNFISYAVYNDTDRELFDWVFNATPGVVRINNFYRALRGNESTLTLSFEPVNTQIVSNPPNLLPGSFNVSRFSDFRSSATTVRDIIEDFETRQLSYFKDYKFIPWSLKGDNVSQIFSSKSLFDNIYSRFFDNEGNAKWDTDEISSHVFTTIYTISSKPEGEDANTGAGGNTAVSGSDYGSNHIKWLIFSMICADIGSEIFGGRARFSNRVSDLRNIIYDLYKNLTSGPAVAPFTSNVVNQSFKQLPEVRYFGDYRETPASSGETLYSIVSKTLKEFYHVMQEFCVNDSGLTNHRSNDPFDILLILYEIIIAILIPGFKKFVSGLDIRADSFSLQDKDRVPPRLSDGLSAYNTITSTAIQNTLQKRDNLIRKFFCFISGYLKKTRDELSSILRKINERSLQDFLSDIEGGDDNSPPGLNPDASSKQQASIALNSLLDLQPLFSDPQMRTGSNIPSYNFVNSSLLGDKTKEALFSLMQNDSFLREGRVISVGIPNGFFDEILYKPKEAGRRAWTYSQKDIVKLKVYKIELTRPDIVFYPVVKEFELSRLIAREDSLLKFDRRGNYDVSIGQFPTRDFDNQGDKSAVQYYHPDPSTRSVLSRNNNFSALTGPGYQDVADPIKTRIYRNHVESYLLEIYMRIMTGISLSEGNISDFSGISLSGIQDKIRSILSDPNVVLEPFESFESLGTNNPSTLSPTAQIALNILAPKRFDRVLNVLVRDEDFVINFEKTDESLKNDPDIQKKTIDFFNTHSYSLKPRVYSFERYFATIEIDERRGVI